MWMIRKGCECRKKWQSPTFGILGSKILLNMRGGLEASSIVHGMLETFARNFTLFEIPAKLKTTPQTIDDTFESLCMFGELLEPKIRMLDFAILSTVTSFANRLRAPWKPYLTNDWNLDCDPIFFLPPAHFTLEGNSSGSTDKCHSG